DEAEYCHRLALMHRGRVIALGSPDELRGKLAEQTLLYLETSDLLEASKALADEPAILDVALFGAGLHLTAKDLGAAEDAVRRQLDRARLRIDRLEPISPSMEDVFVALIEREEREGKEAA